MHPLERVKWFFGVYDVKSRLVPSVAVPVGQGAKRDFLGIAEKPRNKRTPLLLVACAVAVPAGEVLKRVQWFFGVYDVKLRLVPSVAVPVGQGAKRDFLVIAEKPRNKRTPLVLVACAVLPLALASCAGMAPVVRCVPGSIYVPCPVAK